MNFNEKLAERGQGQAFKGRQRQLWRATVWFSGGLGFDTLGRPEPGAEPSHFLQGSEWNQLCGSVSADECPPWHVDEWWPHVRGISWAPW